jgi:disulfide bond formation protein DsbB
MKKIIAFFTDYKNLSLTVALVSFAALAFAYTTQYVFNHQPCPLCLWQRKPYFLAILFGLLAFTTKKEKLFLSLAGLSFMTGAVIAGFHTGVEQAWWKGLDSCSDTSLPEGVSLEEMQKYLMNRPIVRCDVPGWVFLGISMTAYNFMLSWTLALFTFFFTFRGGKK